MRSIAGWSVRTEKIMLRQFRVLVLLALAALVWNVTPAYSTVLNTYTDLASWQAATSGVLTADFETSTPYNTATGVSAYPNVDFIGYSSVPSFWLQVVNTTGSPFWDFGSGNALMQDMNRPTAGSPPLPFIHVVFSAPVTAFGSDLFTTSPTALNFAVTVQGTQYIVNTFTKPTRAFWGVTTDTPISFADFTVQGTNPTGGTEAFLDNFRYGTAQAGPPPPDAPEAATLVMIGSGLIGLAYMRKRNKPTQPV
jgi:hypothetical protein